MIPKHYKITLGMNYEVSACDFTDWGWGAESIVEWLHNIAYVHLVSRDVYKSYPWSVRVQNIFYRNKITTLGHLINMPQSEIDVLKGCGIQARREVYNAFRCEWGLTLPQWNPILGYQKYIGAYSKVNGERRL